MKYSVGKKVRIKSNDWYLQNKRSDNNVECGETFFTREMVPFCSSIMTIDYISPINGIEFYRMKEDKEQYCWTDEMIECKVEEETQPKFKIGDKVITNKGYIGKFEGWVSDYQVRVLFEESFKTCGRGN